MAGTDFSHLTNDELIKGIKALDLPGYIRSKAYGIDVRETLAQMTEMTIQLGVNMGLSPDDALKWARKLQESVSQSEFDSWVATLLDGGPSIFMNTLNELKTTYPNGAAGVALVRETDPAKIYVWNGTAWEDFGDYQGIELKDGTVTTDKIEDEAITMDKTDFINTYTNIYDNDSSVTGGIPNYLTGGLYETNGVMSQHIPVEEGKYYSQSVDTNKAFYDANGNYVTGGLAVDMPSPFKVPSGMGIKTVKIGFYNRTPVSNRMFVKGKSLPPISLAYGESYNENKFSIYNEDIAEKAVDYNQTTFLKKIENLFDKSKAKKGFIPNYSTGGEFASPSGFISDYIPVKHSTIYSLSTVRTIAYYDKDFNFLYGTPQDLTKNQVRTRPVTRMAYARYGFYEGPEFTNAMIIEGEQLPDTYVPYGSPKLEVAELLSNSLQSSSNIKGLKWNALGDSITQGSGTTKTYIDYITEATGVVARNYGISGTMISSVEVPNGVGMSIRYEDMSDDADIITVFGGTNDYGHGVVEIGSWEDTGSETLYGGTKTLVKGLMSKYPTAKIGFILPIPRHGINGTNNLGNYVAAIKDV